MKENNNQYIDKRHRLVILDNPAITEIDAMKAITEICEFTLPQCMQISLIASAKGSCEIKRSFNLDLLLEISGRFKKKGISTEIISGS